MGTWYEENTPLSNFPDKECDLARMSDPDADMMILIRQYQSYASAGDKAACDQMLLDNPEMIKSLFTADYMNRLADEVTALQHYQLTNIDDLITKTAQNAIGINDNPSQEEAGVTAYSAEYINDMMANIDTRIAQIQNTAIVTLQVNSWSNSAPYSQRVAVPRLKATDNPSVSSWTPKTLSPAAAKLQQKMAAFITAGTTEDGYITLYCGYRKPTANFQVILEGVSL